MLMESLTEKLLRQVGWQGRVQNNRNSPLDVRSLDCQVLTQVTQTYSPNFFSSRFWRAVVSFTVIYKHTSIYMKKDHTHVKCIPVETKIFKITDGESKWLLFNNWAFYQVYRLSSKILWKIRAFFRAKFLKNKGYFFRTFLTKIRAEIQ